MKKIVLTGMMGLASIIFGVNANADLIFSLGGCDFSSDSIGDSACGGSGADLPDDALTMTFKQTDIGMVQLTIDAAGMPEDTGKIKDIWFNSTYDFGNLTFEYETGVEAIDIIAGGNPFSAVGDFDINFQYDTSGPLGDLFYNQLSVYDISGAGLKVEHFNVPSSGGYWAVMHVGATGNGDSGHYVSQPAPVPEPATMLLFGTGLVGLAGVVHRIKKKR